MTPKKVITITLNPALDTSLWVSSLDNGAVTRTLREESQAGGKGINISRTFHQFGCDAPAFFLCGRQNAAGYAALLKEEGIPFHYALTNGAVRENIHIITDSGSFYKINRQGFEADDKTLSTLCKMVKGSIDQDTTVVIAGSFPSGMDRISFLHFCKAVSKSAGRLVIDTSSFSIDELCSLHPFLIKPNLEEFQVMTSRPFLNRKEAIQLAAEYRKRGISNILLSLGADGLAYIGTEGTFLVQVPAVNAKNTVGAGDNSLAGFLIGALKGLPILEAVKLSAAFGTASVLKEGTHPPQKEDVERILSKVSVVSYQ